MSDNHLLRGEQVVTKRLKSAWAGFTGMFYPAIMNSKGCCIYLLFLQILRCATMFLRSRSVS